MDAYSASIGDGREEVRSIPANHSGMTKFRSPSDIGFQRIIAKLRLWTSELREADKTPSADIEGMS